MKFTLYKKKIADSEYSFWKVVDVSNNFEAVKQSCVDGGLSVPGFVKTERNPQRWYYFVEGCLIYVRRYHPSDDILEGGL